jgi:hypothetical protein
MTSDWVSVCDAIISDFQTNVSELSTSNAVVHKYAPWDPETLQPDVTRQWAVWPIGEQAETAQGLASGVHLFTQTYEVLIWETAEDEVRLVRDEDATADFYQLHNDVRDRLYVEGNQQLGASMQFWYLGSEFGKASATVRWMRIRCQRQIPQDFSS